MCGQLGDELEASTSELQWGAERGEERKEENWEKYGGNGLSYTVFCVWTFHLWKPPAVDSH